MKIKEKLMHKYALSPQGASDMLKAFVSVTVSDLVLMIPVSLLYFIVKDYMEGTLQGRWILYCRHYRDTCPDRNYNLYTI